MNVIRDAANEQGRRIEVHEDASQVGVNAPAKCRIG
jgi:hypothetical protein